MISNIFNNNFIRILTFMLISPGSRYTRNELKNKTKMNNTPFDNSLNTLLNIRILKKEKNFIMINFENEEFKNILDNIRMEFLKFNLPYEIFNIITEVSNALLKEKYIKEIILFGSYAKLIYSEKSDIDIAIILENIKNEKNSKKWIENKLKKMERKSGKKIEAHFFNKEDLKHKEDPLIKDIIKNGKMVI